MPEGPRTVINIQTVERLNVLDGHVEGVPGTASSRKRRKPEALQMKFAPQQGLEICIAAAKAVDDGEDTLKKVHDELPKRGFPLKHKDPMGQVSRILNSAMLFGLLAPKGGKDSKSYEITALGKDCVRTDLAYLRTVATRRKAFLNVASYAHVERNYDGRLDDKHGLHDALAKAGMVGDQDKGRNIRHKLHRSAEHAGMVTADRRFKRPATMAPQAAPAAPQAAPVAPAAPIADVHPQGPAAPGDQGASHDAPKPEDRQPQADGAGNGAVPPADACGAQDPGEDPAPQGGPDASSDSAREMAEIFRIVSAALWDKPHSENVKRVMAAVYDVTKHA